MPTAQGRVEQRELSLEGRGRFPEVYLGQEPRVVRIGQEADDLSGLSRLLRVRLHACVHHGTLLPVAPDTALGNESLQGVADHLRGRSPVRVLLQ